MLPRRRRGAKRPWACEATGGVRRRTVAAVPAVTVLPEPEWRARAAAHRQRMRRFTGPHRERKQRGEKHPVLDFLFTYYSPPARRGCGAGTPGRGSCCAAVRSTSAGPATSRRRRRAPRRPRALPRPRRPPGSSALLAGTAARPAQLGCFGLHEWAMVYRLPGRAAARGGRCGSAPAAPTRWSSPTRCAARTTTPSGSSPRRPARTSSPEAADQVTTSSPAACTPAWTSTSGRTSWPRRARRTWWPLLRAGPRRPRAGHARVPLRPDRLGYSPVPIETRAGRANLRAKRKRKSPGGPLPCGLASSTSAPRCV